MSTYWGLTTPAECEAYFERCLSSGQPIGIDTETTGLNRWRDTVVGLSLSAQWGEGVYIPLAHAPGKGANIPLASILPELKHLLLTGVFNMHHSHFDIVMLARLVGIDPWLIRVKHDSFIMGVLRGDSRGLGGGEGAGLKTQAEVHLGVKRHSFSDFFPPDTPSTKMNARDIDLDLMIPYAAADADDVQGLVPVLEPTMDSMGLRFVYELEMALVPEMLWLEGRGVPIDTELAAAQAAECLAFAEKVEAAVLERFAERLGRPPTVVVKNGWTKPKDHPEREQKWKEVAVNLNSTAHLEQLLFEPAAPKGRGMGLPVVRKTKGGKEGKNPKPSTDEKALKQLANYEPSLGWLLTAREVHKLVGTYLAAESGYVQGAMDRSEPGLAVLHPQYKQVGPETGRTACEEPNMQNVPKKSEFGKEAGRIPEGIAPITASARDLVHARPGYYLIDADWDQVEYRVIGGFSQDPGLLDVFHRGVDLHVKTASLMWHVPEDQVDTDLRGKAKTMNYRIAFGGGAANVAEALGSSVEEAEQQLALRKAAFPYETQWKKSIEEYAKRHRHVQTFFGRKRWFNFNPNAAQGPERKAYFAALREAVNMPVQGTAADLLKITLVRLGPWLREHFPDIRLVLTTHDSITFEVPNHYDPTWLCERLRPVLEFPAGFISGWPAITASFEFGERWGSLKEVPRVAALAVSHEPPTDNTQSLLDMIPAVPLVLEVADISPAQAKALRELLDTLPGNNPITLRYEGEGTKLEIEMGTTCLEAGQGFVFTAVFPEAMPRLYAKVDYAALA